MYPTNSQWTPAPRLVPFPVIAPEPTENPELPASPCHLSGAFLALFEQLTGWRAEFQESPASRKRRQSSQGDKLPPSGDFQIVDMSADWPAKTPTAHRGRCDQLIHLFGCLMDQMQTNRMELTRLRSTLEALSPGSLDEDAELVDSFVPKFDGTLKLLEAAAEKLNQRSMPEAMTNTGESPYDSIYLEYDCDDLGLECDSEFVVHQEISTFLRDATGVWKDWTFGGASGLANSAYLDAFANDQRLTICMGRIESQLGVGDAEVRLEVNPNTKQYRVTGELSLHAFSLWDRRGGKLVPIQQRNQWLKLWPGATIIASTTDQLTAPDPEAELSLHPTAEQFATVLRRQLTTEERILVLKHQPAFN